LFCISHGSSNNHFNLNNFKKYDNSDCNAKFSLHETSVSPNSCHDAHDEEVQVTFSSSIVENEYIIKFNGYYKAHARENYIRAVLNSSNIKNWKIIPHNNAVSMYPSDFDIVRLQETNKYDGLRALSNHPLIKTVSPQRLIHRTLKFINITSNDSDILEYKNFERRINVSFEMYKNKITIYV